MKRTKKVFPWRNRISFTCLQSCLFSCGYVLNAATNRTWQSSNRAKITFNSQTFSYTLYFLSFETLWDLRCGFPPKETFSILIGHTDWNAVCPGITFGQWQMWLYWKRPHSFLTERDKKSGNENKWKLKCSATTEATDGPSNLRDFLLCHIRGFLST